MARDFYPRREADILTFTKTLSERIELDPQALGLTSEQSASYALKQSAFADLYRACEVPSTRTSPRLVEKRDAAAALEAETRMLVRIVRAMPFVSDAQLVDLGLKPRSARGAAIPAPGSAPQIVLLWVRGREVCIELRDADHPDNAGKPSAAGWANLYAYVGHEPPADGRGWSLARTTTRSRAKVPFGPDVPAGAQVWVMARWFNRRGEPGPASIAITAYLQGGVVTSSAVHMAA